MQTSSNAGARMAERAERATNTALGTAMNTGMAWFDMMLNFQREMQRASWQSLSSYSPTSDTRITGALPSVPAATQVIAVGEERLNVATRTIQGETTRIRRRVVSQPVEQQVTLRNETVVVERRPAASADPRPDVLTETVIEMSDSRQVPTVWKSLHVAEEVVLRKQVSERVEHVRDTVRRDVVDVEHEGDQAREAAAALTRAAVEQTLALAPKVAAPTVAMPAHQDSEARVQAQAAEQREQRAAEQRVHEEADKSDRKPATPAALPGAARKN